MFEIVLRAVLALIVLIGAWAVLRGSDPFLWLLLLVNFCFVFVPGPMGYARFRFPVEASWFIPAMIGLVWLASRLGWAGLRDRLPSVSAGRVVA